MKIPLQITVRDIPASEALDAHIREKAAKLEQFYPQLIGCRVVVELPHKHKHQGKQFAVRIDLTVPGSEIVINRDQSEDVYVALRDAFDAARRKLEDYARRQRGDVKNHEMPVRGRVARLFPEEGYGFIVTTEGDEVYFSSDNLVNVGFDDLKPGEEVQFIEESAQEGVQAKRVSVGKHHIEQ